MVRMLIIDGKADPLLAAAGSPTPLKLAYEINSDSAVGAFLGKNGGIERRLWATVSPAP